MIELIDYLHIISSVLYGVAACYKLHARQSEHFYSRIIVSVWFMITFLFRVYLPMQWVRELSNYVLMTVPIIEIVSPTFMKYWKNKK